MFLLLIFAFFAGFVTILAPCIWPVLPIVLSSSIAGKVFIILRPGNEQLNTVKVFLDGKIIDANVAGADVTNGILTVDSDRLYNIVDLHGKTENHILKLEFQTPGIQAYTFTFG
jgi:hypothetical protein